MIDDEFEKLKNIKVPKPSAKARESAAFAAMDAFDSASDAASETSAVKINSKNTQGSAVGVRPTSITSTLWSTIMDNTIRPFFNMRRSTAALLTGVMLVPVAGITAWNVLEETLPPQTVKPGLQDTMSVGDNPPLLRKDDAGALKLQAPAKKERRAQPSATADALTGRSQQGRAPLGQTRSERDKLVRNGLSSGVTNNQGIQHMLKPAAPAMESLSEQSSPQSKAKSIVRVLPVPVPQAGDSENYTDFDDNAVKSVKSEPVSTFSIDVDTASYARVRRAITEGALPGKDAVRVEEMINYFDYSYPLPDDKAVPFKPSVTVMPTPWNANTKLMHIGIKGYDVVVRDQPPANLVFLLDVSGSMNAPDKLPLLKSSFRLLLNKLKPQDTVSIVTYAGRSATVLEPTKASEKDKIFNALDNLGAGGSTGGAEGIKQAYRLAKRSFVKGGVNRVMLATDGDFNVGISDPEKLKDFIADKRKTGVFLSVFGFGTGNYNDALMQSLAQNGNGTAAYIDTLAEAQKTLVEEAGSTLFPIAKDVKIQMEFNPAKIAEYRLVGYETRALKKEDFNNDKVDAGDIGSGHSVTAIYEITPVGSPAVLNTDLRYSANEPNDSAAEKSEFQNEYGFLKLRYKLPNEDKSKLIETPITTANEGAGSTDAKFSVAVSAFAQKLRGNAMVGMSYDEIIALANANRGEDIFGYRTGFVQMVRLAKALN